MYANILQIENLSVTFLSSIPYTYIKNGTTFSSSSLASQQCLLKHNQNQLSHKQATLRNFLEEFLVCLNSP